jgi:hypothetical protein
MGPLDHLWKLGILIEGVAHIGQRLANAALKAAAREQLKCIGTEYQRDPSGFGRLSLKGYGYPALKYRTDQRARLLVAAWSSNLGDSAIPPLKPKALLITGF